MPRWTGTDVEWDGALDPDEDEENAEFWGDEDKEPTIPFPYCRREIHEDAQRCPYCGRYIAREDVPPGREPRWIVLGVASCLYVLLH